MDLDEALGHAHEVGHHGRLFEHGVERLHAHAQLLIGLACEFAHGVLALVAPVPGIDEGGFLRLAGVPGAVLEDHEVISG
ncbi:hypothetical protein HNQ39_005138 [Armatimonas rosea]|uniref:Uncharacterized protein n=1 Tax=Armatimonas rosea TaxID=685828 RepID=A0A7W9SW53_ARMRO|nr:hypothetical protein [Armatimonas rosea]